MKLTRIERNQIYQAIAESGNDPAEFQLTATGAKTLIAHDSGSTFEFQAHSFLNTKYSFKAIVEDGSYQDSISDRKLAAILELIREWGNEVKLIADTPDLWAEMRRNRELIAGIQQADSDNTPFTEDEQGKIEARLQAITKQLKEQFELTKEQEERIDEWHDDVVEASTRMGRKDWFIYLLGTVTAVAIAATVPAGAGEHILAMVIHALGYLFTGGAEPPQILT